MNFSVKLWNSWSTTLNYDEFVDEYMEKWEEPEMNETDEEFEKRCLEAWKKVLNKDDDEEFEEEEDEDGDGDSRIQELSSDYVDTCIADPRVDEYHKIVEKRIKLEALEKKRQEDERKKMESEDALGNIMRKFHSIIVTQEEKEKADRVAKLRAELRSLGEIC